MYADFALPTVKKKRKEKKSPITGKEKQSCFYCKVKCKS